MAAKLKGQMDMFDFQEGKWLNCGRAYSTVRAFCDTEFRELISVQATGCRTNLSSNRHLLRTYPSFSSLSTPDRHLATDSMLH